MKRVGVLILTLGLLLKTTVTFAQIGSGVLITEVMTASTTSASSEFVELYNQSDNPINVTGWKVQYSSDTGSAVTTKATLSGAVVSHGFLLVASSAFQAEQNISADADLSSGLAGSGGRVKLVDSGGNVIDALSYGPEALSSEGLSAAAPAAEQSLKRIVDGDAQFVDDNMNSTDFAISDSPFAQGGGVGDVVDVPIDVCPNIDGIQITVPDGYNLDANGDCIIAAAPDPDSVAPPVDYELKITELLPNAVDSDEGNEFIEIYNPNSTAVGLDGYRLYIGQNYEKNYNFPSNLEISPGQYLAFYNSEIHFTLVNSTSRAKLVSPASRIVSETDNYQDPGDGQSWSLFDDGWKLTDSATPDALNQYVTNENNVTDASGASLQPCRADQFRNPLTNRCKLKSSAGGDLAACAADQYRNPETNRCRKLSSANSSLTSCKTGQERNPATNRCRKIGSGLSSLKPCQLGYERNKETNRCRKVIATVNSAFAEPAAINPINLNSKIIALLIAMAGGYAAYEYHTDIANLIDRIRSKRGNPRPPG